MPRTSLRSSSTPDPDRIIAALHPLHLAATSEEVWTAVLAFLRPCVAHAFIELFLPELAGRQDDAAWNRWAALFPGYIRSRGVTISRNYLQSHPRARVYTFSEILEVDPTAAEELQIENNVGTPPLPAAEPAPPRCHDFANLVFWSPQGQLRAMLSVCRREEHGPFTPRDHADLSQLYWAVHAALERVARQRRERARRECAEAYVGTLPAAALFVNGGGEVLFANHAAYDLCAMWNFGPQKAVSFNTRACFALPEAIHQAIVRLQANDEAELSAGGNGAGRTSPPAPGPSSRIVSTQVVHPAIRGLSAAVHRQPDSLTAEPGTPRFVISLTYRDTFLGANSTALHATALQLLSPAERRVALLARDGLTNKEIASRLKRALPSVVWTLHVIYQKVGVRNRAQLAKRLL